MYNPCQDCSGIEYINITMYEEQRDPDIPPANTTDTIIINIQPVNDPPVIFLFHQGVSLLNDDPTEPVNVRSVYLLYCIVDCSDYLFLIL